MHVYTQVYNHMWLVHVYTFPRTTAVSEKITVQLSYYQDDLRVHMHSHVQGIIIICKLVWVHVHWHAQDIIKIFAFVNSTENACFQHDQSFIITLKYSTCISSENIFLLQTFCSYFWQTRMDDIHLTCLTYHYSK